MSQHTSLSQKEGISEKKSEKIRLLKEKEGRGCIGLKKISKMKNGKLC